MKKLSILLNIFLLIVVAWQNWRIDDIKKDADWAYHNSEFWHDECAHWKIYGKGTS